MSTPKPPEPEFTFSSAALPDELRELIGMMLEGKVGDLCFVARLNDENDTIVQGMWGGIDGQPAKAYTMAGALAFLQQNWTKIVQEAWKV